ncbi:hypothetical protein EMIHUDRAFT_247194 [Emiliania huxleyi CCMP1516]|nr:hypothetical protein EMIHUDRAFT_247194 [Emiliania huxleyi CCMP1516]EOD13014.1 hypothetical protein EMIHUDRAFT_247194 [Emiliania huxleyi CCMP1516]|eukprot:XP_005765443.1 hypothetical protein EMIHUDRAFT_247194 [Emiliania huxleyi CCMP1516]
MGLPRAARAHALPPLAHTPPNASALVRSAAAHAMDRHGLLGCSLQHGVEAPEALPPRTLFWHVSNADEVVMRQADQIERSDAFRAGMRVKFVASDGCVRPQGESVSEGALAMLERRGGFERARRPRGLQCRQGYREYFELPTLLLLHEHCSLKPGRELVAYAHTKTNGDTWCHFSGNFWWARCDHVRTLNPPFSEELLSEGEAADRTALPAGNGRRWHGSWRDIRPYGRYFAEWWLLNDKTRPRDSFYGGAVEERMGNATRSLATWRAHIWRQAHLLQNDARRTPAFAAEVAARRDIALTPLARRLVREDPGLLRWPRQCGVHLPPDCPLALVAR